MVPFLVPLPLSVDALPILCIFEYKMSLVVTILHQVLRIDDDWMFIHLSKGMSYLVNEAFESFAILFKQSRLYFSVISPAN